MASGPTFHVSESEEEPAQSSRVKPSASPGSGSLLSVPAPVRSNIGINNPAALGGGGGGGGLFPLPHSQQIAGSATGNPRNKVALGRGFSLMDWVRLTKSGKDLSGVGGPMVKGKPREVTRQELRKHRKRQDAWMALNGAVYNVTQYMDFHPGGWDELVKGAGRDATDMFNEIHKWVNYQGMMEACLVGKLVDGPSQEKLPSLPSLAPPPPPQVLPPISVKPAAPTMDFFQTDSKLTVNVYTKRKGLKRQDVIIDNHQDTIRVVVLLPLEEMFTLHLKLSGRVESPSVVRAGETSGKIEIDLKKSSPGRWPSLGSPLEHHLRFGPRKDVAETWRDWTVRSCTADTDNTRHLVLCPPPGCHQRVATGRHVTFKASVEGVEVTRSYTPVVPLLKGCQQSEECLEFLIKVYPDGVMTPGLGELKPGDTVSVSNPQGDFLLSSVPLTADCKLYLLAAGTGLTPMIGLLSAIQKLPRKPAVKLLTFDRTAEDVIWRTEVSQFQMENSDWLSLVRVLSQPATDWRGQTGRVRPDLLLSEVSLVEGLVSRWAAVCGPPGFNREAARILREHLAFTQEEIHVFDG